MRVTSQYLLNNFNADQQKVNEELKKVTEQISSGKEIQNNYDDPSVYNDTLKFDTHINELKGIQERTQKAQNFTSATDTTLQDFSDSIRTFKSELIRASNDSLNADDREAIASALEKEKEYMLTLANTQVAGQYIFSGSATSVKPFDADGTYHGNSQSLDIVLGEGVSTAYNIDGSSLFMGSDDKVQKKVSTNIALKNTETDQTITLEDSLSKLTGDETNPVDFYISGYGHDGTLVKSKVTLNPDETVQKLLDRIGEAYGNTPDNQLVDVTLDEKGHIVVTDLRRGKSQLELKLRGEQNATEIKFNENGYTLAVEGNDDSAYFVQNGNKIEGNIALMANGNMADTQTKLSDISNGSLDGKVFEMKVYDVDGISKDVTLNLDNNGSSFSVDGLTYTIYNAEEDSNGNGVATGADEMTMGQLNDVIAMVISGNLPAANSKSAYDQALVDARKEVEVSISQSGKMQIENLKNDTEIAFAFYDTKAGDFTDTSPSFSLMANDAVTTQKAEMDFFTQIDEIIQAVRNGTQSLDAKNENPRNIGLQDAIAQMEQFDDYFNSNLAKVGVMENTLTNARDRAQSMELSLKELQSELTDVDIAEAYMNLNQLSLSYQAILSSVTKVNSLTLLNYMK